MSVSSGTCIDTSGLVFETDPANRKSFAGYGSERLGGIYPSWGVWGGLTGNTVSYIGSTGTPGAYLNTITSGGVEWWNSNVGKLVCTSSTQYVITAKIRYTGGTPSPNLFYVRQYNSVDAQTSENGKFTSSQLIDLKDGFYLAYAYFTTDAAATSFLVHGYEYTGGLSIWLEDIQCRAAGLGDLTNFNSGALQINLPTFDLANKKTMLYNGTNQYMAIPSMANQPSTAITAMGWMHTSKAPSASTIRGGVLSSTNSMYLGIIDSVDGNVTHSFHWAVQTTVSRPYSWVPGIPQNAWVHLAGTYDGTTSIAYINGAPVWSSALTGTIPAATYAIGTYAPNGADGSHTFQGNIGMTSIYSRALNGSEIKQSFESTKSKYGL